MIATYGVIRGNGTGFTMQTTASLLVDQISRRMPSADQQIALQLRYGKIGIACVAAAARYQSGVKNPDLRDGLIEQKRVGDYWH